MWANIYAGVEKLLINMNITSLMLVSVERPIHMNNSCMKLIRYSPIKGLSAANPMAITDRAIIQLTIKSYSHVTPTRY